MLGKEVFTVARAPKANPTFGVSWAFPNSYQVGMTSLGYQLVWWLMEQDPDVLVRRVFTDCQEDGWKESELFGFTLPWELDYVNVLKLIKRFGTGVLSGQRTKDSPLVFGGGPVLSANPEPYAEFFDAVLLGDAEAVIPQFIASWKRLRDIPNRQQQLRELSQVEGVYIPSLYAYKLVFPKGPIDQIVAIDDAAPARLKKPVFTPPPDYLAHSVMLAPDTTWANIFLVEIVRSCPQECRFCLASYLTRPFRGASLDAIVEKVDLGRKYTKKIGLLGPSVTEHPQFDRLAEELLKRPDTEISIASIRADSLNPLILEMLHKLGQKSVTIALESGSERLRAIMKKNLTEAQVKQAVDMIDQSGLQAVKFYGIVGLPGELDEDLDETIRLLADLKKSHKRLRFTFGVSSFVPKAQTPFQWAGRDALCARKLEYLRKHLSRLGIDVRAESHNWSDIQSLLSRADRRLGPVLMEIAEGKGNLGAWKASLKHLPDDCPDQSFFASRHIPQDETLPWSHLVDNLKSGMLSRHYDAAHKSGAIQS